MSHLDYKQRHIPLLRDKLLQCLLTKFLRPLGGGVPTPPSPPPRPSAPLGPQSGGLHNIGNTCYLNSILQCLWHLPNFSTYSTEAAPTLQLLRDVQRMSRGPSQGSGRKLDYSLRKLGSSLLCGPSHRIGLQQDPQEIFNELLGRLHLKTCDETYKWTSPSPFSRGFKVHERRIYICGLCEFSRKGTTKKTGRKDN